MGNLETAQDDKIDEGVKMQALHDGNQFYAESNASLVVAPSTHPRLRFSNRTCARQRREHICDHHQRYALLHL